MSDQNELCPVCGGILRVDFTITFFKGGPYEMKVSDMSRMCHGHPPPEQTHDGNLDERDQHTEYHASVEINEDWDQVDHTPLVAIRGGRGDCEHSLVLLDPHQSLSLLSWLFQQKNILEDFVKEQEQ